MIHLSNSFRRRKHRNQANGGLSLNKTSTQNNRIHFRAYYYPETIYRKYLIAWYHWMWTAYTKKIDIHCHVNKEIYLIYCIFQHFSSWNIYFLKQSNDIVLAIISKTNRLLIYSMSKWILWHVWLSLHLLFSLFLSHIFKLWLLVALSLSL
jgi:hypothetical protein